MVVGRREAAHLGRGLGLEVGAGVGGGARAGVGAGVRAWAWAWACRARREVWLRGESGGASWRGRRRGGGRRAARRVRRRGAGADTQSAGRHDGLRGGGPLPARPRGLGLELGVAERAGKRELAW